MNALFLKDLADNTRRGLRGRVENGKSGGGFCFGYDVVRQFDAGSDPALTMPPLIPQRQPPCSIRGHPMLL